MKRTVTLIIIVLIILAGGAYALIKNHSSPQRSTTTMPPLTNANSNPKIQTPVETNEVKIDNMAFTPANISIKKGSVVTWINKDSVKHTVTENDGKDGPSASALTTSSSYTFTFNQIGIFHYHCSIHQEMNGSVTVIE